MVMEVLETEETIEDGITDLGTKRWNEPGEGGLFAIYNVRLNPDMLTGDGFEYVQTNEKARTRSTTILDKAYVFERFSILFDQLGLNNEESLDSFLVEATEYHVSKAEREKEARLEGIAKQLASLNGGTVASWLKKVKANA